jgi:hypothetical protein
MHASCINQVAALFTFSCRSIYHFIPDPHLRMAVFGGASAIASYLAYTFLPKLYQHGELLAPIAISNMIVSTAVYLGVCRLLGVVLLPSTLCLPHTVDFGSLILVSHSLTYDCAP